MPCYEDDFGVRTVVMGSGDILVGACGVEKGGLSGVVFVDNCGKCLDIGTPEKEFAGKRGTDLNTVVRLTFSDIRSIDVVIGALERAKMYFINPEELKKEIALHKGIIE